jgi:hypothetical protein
MKNEAINAINVCGELAAMIDLPPVDSILLGHATKVTM